MRNKNRRLDQTLLLTSVKKQLYSEVKGFYGDDTYSNMKEHANKVGQRHSETAKFAESTVMIAVVFTDCVPGNVRLPYQATDWGMWFPCLCICDESGRFYTWCVASAESGWSHGWETHFTRIHWFKLKSVHAQAAPQCPPPPFSATAPSPPPTPEGSATAANIRDPFEHSTVKTEELDTIVHGRV